MIEPLNNDDYEHAPDGDDFHTHHECTPDGDFAAIWLVPRCASARRAIASAIADGVVTGPVIITDDDHGTGVDSAYKVIDKAAFDGLRSGIVSRSQDARRPPGMNLGQWLENVVHLRRQHPDWSHDQIAAALPATYPPPTAIAMVLGEDFELGAPPQRAPQAGQPGDTIEDVAVLAFERIAVLARAAAITPWGLVMRFDEWLDLFRPLARKYALPLVAVTEIYRVAYEYREDRDDEPEARHKVSAAIDKLADEYGVPWQERCDLLLDFAAMYDDGRDILPVCEH